MPGYKRIRVRYDGVRENKGALMTGIPHREHAKIAIQLVIQNESYARVQPLQKAAADIIPSFSQLFEGIVFLSEHMYIQEPDNGFLEQLLELKTALLIHDINTGVKRQRTRVHVTIDERACTYLDMIVRKYRACFTSRNDFADLLLLNIGLDCTDRESVQYYANRLREIRRLHPIRVKSVR